MTTPSSARPPADNVSHQQVWRLAAPMIISNISVPLVGAVDTAVVGHLPDIHQIGAVALGALIFSFLYWGFGFLKMGITGYIAQAFGVDNQHEINRTLLQYLAMGLVFGVIVIALQVPLINVSLWLLDSSARVEALTERYTRIRIWSAPATLCVYALTGLFVGLHDTRLALVLQLTLNLTNIVLDLLFVLVFEWGVPGVAWATLIAEYTAAICGLALVARRLRIAMPQFAFSEIVSVSELRGVMATNGNIFIRTICLVFAFACFTAQSAKHGELILAVNSVLMHLNSLMAYALDGFAHAVEALAGSAYGARRGRQFNAAIRLTTIWSFCMALLISVAYFFFADNIIALFADDADIMITAADFLIWMIIMPMVACWSFQLDGLFVGTGYAREMRNGMLISTAAYLALLVTLQPVAGNHGLYIALIGFMIMRALTLGCYLPAMYRSANVPETGAGIV